MRGTAEERLSKACIYQSASSPSSVLCRKDWWSLSREEHTDRKWEPHQALEYGSPLGPWVSLNFLILKVMSCYVLGTKIEL